MRRTLFFASGRVAFALMGPPLASCSLRKVYPLGRLID
jgi:hypothetical protein